MGIANHRVEVVKITELIKHPNADSLSIVKIAGYQVVVRTDDFKVGSLAYYVPPDSVVPQTEEFRFIWEGHQEEPDGSVREKHRRITARRFRKEWSEGLLMPMPEGVVAQPGDNLADMLGITHYNPPEEPVGTKGENEHAPGSRRYPKSLKGWFYFLLGKIGIRLNGNTYSSDRENGLALPEYDVEAYKHFTHALVPGEEVIITEKIHGSNARFIYLDGHMYAGSRRLWKSEKSQCVWRQALAQNPWIEEWCRAHEGWALYGEVVPTQGKYDYGFKHGAVGFFVFDIRNPFGEWIPYEDMEALYYTHDVEEQQNWDGRKIEFTGKELVQNLNWVPILYRGAFTPTVATACAEGPSTVPDAKHVREGCVIRPMQERTSHNLGRVQLKVVSNTFLEAETK